MKNYENYENYEENYEECRELINCGSQIVGK